MEKRDVVIDWKTISLLVNNNFDSNNPTIFLHWWGQNKYSFGRNIDYYENKGLSYISIDLPWFGESFKPDENWTIQEYAIIIEKIIKLFKINIINVVWHWFGWDIVIYAALNNIIKINKLVLIASWWNKTKYKKIHDEIINLIKNVLWKIGLKSLIKKIKANITKSTYRKYGSLEKIYQNIHNNNVNLIINKINFPTLLIWWTKDKQNNISNAYYMNKNIPNSILFKIEWWDHFPHVQHPSMVNSKINQFIYNWK